MQTQFQQIKYCHKTALYDVCSKFLILFELYKIWQHCIFTMDAVEFLRWFGL